MHVDQGDFVLRRNGSHDVWVFAVTILKIAFLVKTPTHNRCEQNRDRLSLANFGDESDQIPSIVFRWGVAIRPVLRSVVVSEFDEDVVAFPQLVEDALPEFLFNKGP